MMNSINLSAPAKVNLFLKVLNKRKDGYHNIVTLFERITLSDRIRISKIPSGIIVSSDKFITRNPEENLVYRAAALVLKRGRIKKGVRIAIKKRIPIAAGMGGGSSDAASVLSGVNKLYNIGLSKKDLAMLGSRLGADVPFFILDKPYAIGRGLGTRLKEVKLKKTLWHVIVCHGQKISTKDIYEAFDRSSKDLTRDFRDDKISASLVQSMDFNAVEAMLYNSLEKTVLVKLPVTGSILKRLASTTGRKSILTGSGPGVFCLCRNRKEAIGTRDRLLGSLPARDKLPWQAFIAKTKI